MSAAGTGVLRVANCSGFYGDRLSAAREMVDGGPIDVLTGDWLAELTMLILARGRMKDPGAGYAKTFVTQMRDVLGDCVASGIKVVSNAGGLNPAGCAAALRSVATELGVDATIATVTGDDLSGRLDELRAAGVVFVNLDTGEDLDTLGITPLTANAYLGCWGIAEALERGADVVVTGRVTDAAVVMGPAAWHHGWGSHDLDALAGALVAGHVIECGPQATGGNYSFFEAVEGLEHPGFPIAEVAADGTSVITKHPGTGGRVDVGTVTAQLLYEIGGHRYLNPDVTARFDSIRLDEVGPDRVRISGVVGEAPPATAKVAMNYLGGFRNSMTFGITGLDVEAKAALLERSLWERLGGRESFAESEVQLIPSGRDDPRTNEDAVSHLRLTVKDADQAKVGRSFSSAVVELALANYPGFFATSPPGEGTPFGVYWPTQVPVAHLAHEVDVDGETVTLQVADALEAHVETTGTRVPAVAIPSPPPADSESAQVPLGRICGARSGDKGGNANVGLWAVSAEAYAWLVDYLDLDMFHALVPEAAGLEVQRHRFDNLWALNFVVVGLLGRGVADSTRSDPQAKGFGEYLRAKVVDVPAVLLD
ncbi:MAG: acyclic terpene utilization AtuA family protein [Acidimicrobiia bacterium]